MKANRHTYHSPTFGEDDPKSQRRISRRHLIVAASALGLAGAAAVGTLEALASPVKRLNGGASTFPIRGRHTPTSTPNSPPTTLPDIQFDIGNYIAPVQTINGIQFHFGPVYTLFATARLTRTPTRDEQRIFADALDTIEDRYDFSPSGVFTFVSYGLPYFRRLRRSMVGSYIPRLAHQPFRSALEEAVPGPTDVSPLNPGISKKTFNVPLVIERNDMLFSIRSDQLGHLSDVVTWLEGSNSLNGQRVPSPDLRGLFEITSRRLMFAQPGLPRKLANSSNLPYAGRINPTSPMWMGFADQHVDGAGPSAIVTFLGNDSARLTTARHGDYFANGSIQHLAHDIQDLAQFYSNSTADPEPFTERCQYMFRSNPIPSTGNTDQYTDGGGPAYIDNTFRGPDDALHNAQAINTFNGEHRMGHLSALQRSSRAADGTPVHIRMDGPGFDAFDVPDGSMQPKLQFSIFVPTADFFATMRKNSAALDLVEKYGVDPDDNGLERFITATRRQNFLVPPRSHRAFPLLEFSSYGGR